MRFDRRLAKLEELARSLIEADLMNVITAVPVDCAEADGRAPGLYRTGPPGSIAGMLVFDPAKGEPEVPEDRVAPGALVIVYGPEYVVPPLYSPSEQPE